MTLLQLATGRLQGHLKRGIGIACILCTLWIWGRRQGGLWPTLEIRAPRSAPGNCRGRGCPTRYGGNRRGGWLDREGAVRIRSDRSVNFGPCRWIVVGDGRGGWWGCDARTLGCGNGRRLPRRRDRHGPCWPTAWQISIIFWCWVCWEWFRTSRIVGRTGWRRTCRWIRRSCRWIRRLRDLSAGGRDARYSLREARRWRCGLRSETDLRHSDLRHSWARAHFTCQPGRCFRGCILELKSVVEPDV